MQFALFCESHSHSLTFLVRRLFNIANFFRFGCLFGYINIEKSILNLLEQRKMTCTIESSVVMLCWSLFIVIKPFSFSLPQCFLLSWFQGTASLTLSTQCFLDFATLYSKTSHTCPRMPPSQNPLHRPTLCHSFTLPVIATQIPPAVVAPSPFLIHPLAPILAVHSRCQVSHPLHLLAR